MSNTNHLQRIITVLSTVQNTEDRRLILSLTPNVITQFIDRVKDELTIFTATNPGFNPAEDYMWIPGSLPHLRQFLPNTDSPPSQPRPAYSSSNSLHNPAHLIPTNSNNPSNLPLLPQAPPVTGAFSIPTQSQGNANARRVASAFRHTPNPSTSAVLSQAMNLAQTHARNPLSTAAGPLPVMNRVGIFIYPLHIALQGEPVIDEIGSHSCTLDPTCLPTLISEAKRLGLYTYLSVRPTEMIKPTDITTALEAFLSPRNMRLPLSDTRSLSSDPTALCNQPFRILYFWPGRSPPRYELRICSTVNDLNLRYSEIANLAHNRIATPFDADPNTMDKIPILPICPTYGHLEGTLTGLEIDPTTIPLIDQAKFHACFSWCLMLELSKLLSKPPRDHIQMLQECLSSPLCPAGESRPSTPPAQVIGTRRQLELSPTSSSVTRHVRPRPDPQPRNTPTPPSDLTLTTPAVPSPPSPTIQNHDPIPQRFVSPSTQDNSSQQLNHNSTPTQAVHASSVPSVDMPTLLSSTDIASRAQIRLWTKRVQRKMLEDPAPIDVIVDTLDTGVQFLMALTENATNSSTTDHDFKPPTGTQSCEGTPTLLSLFKPIGRLELACSPGPGPMRNIYSRTIETLAHSTLWKQAPKGPWVIPILTPILGDNTSHLTTLQRQGIIIASFMYQFRTGPVPLSPWLILYLICGRDIIDSITPSLLHTLDHEGFVAFSPILNLKANEPRPRDLFHPINQFFINTLDMQPFLLGDIPSEAVVRKAREIAFATVFFDMNPAVCAATPHPLEHPALNALCSGFSVILDNGCFGGPPYTFVSTFFKPRSKLATPPQLVAGLYHRLPDTVTAVLRHLPVGIQNSEFTRDTPDPLLALFTKLFELYLYRFFHGKGIPPTYTPETDANGNEADHRDPFFRFKKFMYAATGLHGIPPNDNYQIIFKLTTITLVSKGTPFPNHIPPPLNIHTCFSQIDVHLNDGMRKMLLDVPDTSNHSSIFDAWFFSQIISNTFNAI